MWRKHMLTHSSKRDRRYQCPLCVKTFLTAGHLDVHIRSHTREPLRCDRCERTFTSSVWLQKHAVSLGLVVTSIWGRMGLLRSIYSRVQWEHQCSFRQCIASSTFTQICMFVVVSF